LAQLQRCSFSTRSSAHIVWETTSDLLGEPFNVRAEHFGQAGRDTDEPSVITKGAGPLKPLSDSENARPRQQQETPPMAWLIATAIISVNFRIIVAILFFSKLANPKPHHLDASGKPILHDEFSILCPYRPR
jgi:hypothetical protein